MFDMHLERTPYETDACVEYALIPEGLRRTLKLDQGVPAGCRADDPGMAVTHVNLFHLWNDHHGLEGQWQFPPGPPSGPIIAATVIVEGDKVHAAVRYATGKCSEWWTHDLIAGAPMCETPAEGGDPCVTPPCTRG